MLNAIRKRATSWVVRVFLVLLILSFAVWGVGDILQTGAPGEVVAEVDGLPVSGNAVRREAELGFQRLQNQFGGQLPRDSGIMTSLTQQALQGAIARRLIDAHARDLGLAVADQTLVQEVRSEPSFQTNGVFDRARFDAFLRGSGIDEAGFFEQLRMDVLRGNLVRAVTGGATGSETAARLLESHRGEQRSGRALVIDAAAMTPPAPGDAALQAHLDANQAAFQWPELRTARLVELTPDALLGEVEVDEATVADEYERRLAQYRTPEQRRATQLLAADRAVLEEAATALGAGRPVGEVATELAARGVTQSELGPIERGALPPALDEALFSQAEGAVGSPVQSDFGWHLLVVDSVTPEQVTPLAEVQEALRQELRRREAADRLPDLANRLDDALGGGADLAEAAAGIGIEPRTVTVDRTGMTRTGGPPEGGPLPPDRVAEIFTAGQGETSLLQTDDAGNYYVFELQTIEPARPKSLEEAREAVLAAWRRDEQAKLARAEAERLLAEAKAGKPLEELAAALPAARVVNLGPVRRDAPEGGLSLGPAAHAALFATAPGATAEQVVEVPGGVALIVTDGVTPAEPAAALAETRDELGTALQNDLAQSYEAALRARYDVTTDAAALTALLPQQP